MFSSFLQLSVELRDLSQAEKEITLFKAKQTHKMATFLLKMTISFTQVSSVQTVMKTEFSLCSVSCRALYSVLALYGIAVLSFCKFTQVCIMFSRLENIRFANSYFYLSLR